MDVRITSSVISIPVPSTSRECYTGIVYCHNQKAVGVDLSPQTAAFQPVRIFGKGLAKPGRVYLFATHDCDDELVKRAQWLLEKLSYPWEMMPLMYVILKSADGDVQKAHQRIDEVCVDKAKSKIRCNCFGVQKLKVIGSHTHAVPHTATTTKTLLDISNQTKKKPSLQSINTKKAKRSIKTYELVKSSLDRNHSDRLTEEDDEDENISVTNHTNSTGRSRSSSRSRSRSCSRHVETPRADERALNLDTKYKPASTSASSREDDREPLAFDEGSTVISHGRPASSHQHHHHHLHQHHHHPAKYSQTEEVDHQPSSNSPVSVEEPTTVYDVVVETGGKRARARLSPAQEAEQKSPAPETTQHYEAYLDSVRRSKKSATAKEPTDTQDATAGESYEKEKEMRIPYSLPKSTFDRLDLLKKPNGLNLPALYKYNAIDNNFAFPLLLPGLGAANRTLYPTPFSAQLLPSTLYQSVSSESTTIPMFQTHFLGYQPPLQLPEHFYRSKEQQQQLEQQQQQQQQQQLQALEPKEPTSTDSTSPPKATLFYATTVDNSIASQQASIATIL
ncbi:lateral signaling target protein 2 homolog [Anopheles coustani]|uniref:lateral signaling target protein 2 homolog n=1 Tax=Anopheles coustani TaxID=139045 RepID=UPI0026583DBF|nr:lateral signaling target protein 2 homolog [Anopheles coustani]